MQTIHVSEGQSVGAGERLASLRVSTDAAGGDTGATLTQGLAREDVASGARDAAHQKRTRTSPEAARGSRWRTRREPVADGSATRRLELSRAEVERAESIASKGFLPLRELDSRRNAALDAAAAVSQGRTASLQIQREIDEARTREETLQAELALTAAETASRDVLVLTAPVSGQVSALPPNPGQSLAPGEAAVVLTPAGSGLGPGLYVRSSAIGFIRVG